MSMTAAKTYQTFIKKFKLTFSHAESAQIDSGSTRTLFCASHFPPVAPQ